MAKIPATTGRVVIEAESPQVDGGRFAAKRVVGEAVTIEADVFGDGHDAIGALLRHRQARRETVGRDPHDAHRQRSMASRVRSRHSRCLAVRDRGVAGPFRHLARWAGEEGGRRGRREHGPAHRGRSGGGRLGAGQGQDLPIAEETCHHPRRPEPGIDRASRRSVSPRSSGSAWTPIPTGRRRRDRGGST